MALNKIRDGILKPTGLDGNELIELDDTSIGTGDPNFYYTTSGNLLSKLFGNLDANSNTIINLLDPINPQDAATRKFVEDSISGSSFFYFFSDTAEGTIPDYFLMYTNPTGEPESTKSSVIPANDTLITSFITETDQPDFTLLLAGIYDAHIHAAKTAGIKDVQIYWKLFKRASGGTETELFTSTVSSNVPVTNTEFDLHGNLTTDENLAVDDRLVVKFYGNPVGLGTDPTITLYLEGTNASRIEIKTTVEALFPQEKQIYHVSAAGNNSNSGKNRQNALLNTNNGISKINTDETPSSSNRFVVYNPDAHNEVGFILQTRFVNLYLPNTEFSTGQNILYSDTVVIIDSAELLAGGSCVTKQGTGIGYFKANFLRGGVAGINIMLNIAEGTLIANVSYFNIDEVDDVAIKVQDDAKAYINSCIVKGKVEIGNDATLFLCAQDISNVIFTGTGILYLNAQKASGINLTGFTGTVYRFSLDNGGVIKPFLAYDSHPTFTADTQLIDKKYVDDHAASTTFLDLTDTPSSYTAAKDVYVVNDSVNGVKESTVKIDDNVPNTLSIQQGTTTLTATANSQLNQNLTTTSSPTLYDLNISNQLKSQLGIIGGSTQDSSAQFQIDSTTKGFLPPRMTTAQRTGISSPEEGLQVHDTIEKVPYFHNGTAWEKIGNGATVFPDEDQIYHVGAHGSDTNSAKNRQNAMLRPQAAYTKIVADETPSDTNKFVIYNPDALVSDSFQTNDWISVYTPNTTYRYGGTNILRENSYALVNTMQFSGGSDGFFRISDPGISYLKVINEIQMLSGTAASIYFQQDGGTHVMEVGNCNVRSDDIMYIRLTAKLYLNGGKMKGVLRVTDNAIVYLNVADTSELTFDIQDNGKVIKSPLLPNKQIYYVGKHGKDTGEHLGKNWDSDAFLTFGKAITEIIAQTPSITNQFTICCKDSGIYDEQITIPAFVNLDAPNATLKSTNSTGHTLYINGAQDNVFKIHTISAQSSDASVSINPESTSHAFLNINSILNNGTGDGIEFLDGYTTGNIHFCEKLYCGANGEIELEINRLENGATLIGGSTGSLIVGRLISGTIDKQSGSTVTTFVVMDNKIYHEYYMTGNTTETPIATLYTPVKIAGTTTEGLNNSYFTHSSNRLTYNNSVTNIFEIRAQLSWEMVGSTSQETIKCYIYLNGSVIGKSTMTGRVDDDGDAPFIISVQCLTEISQNDYIEIWLSVETGATQNILVNDMNVIVQKIN